MIFRTKSKDKDEYFYTNMMIGTIKAQIDKMTMSLNYNKNYINQNDKWTKNISKDENKDE